jgi:hypothetical protein
MKITKGHINQSTWGKENGVKDQKFYNDQNDIICRLTIDHELKDHPTYTWKKVWNIDYYTVSMDLVKDETHYTTEWRCTELLSDFRVYDKDGNWTTVYNKLGYHRTRKEAQQVIRRCLQSTVNPKSRFKLKITFKQSHHYYGTKVFYRDLVCIDTREEAEQLIKNLCGWYCPRQKKEEEEEEIESIEIIDLEEEEEEEEAKEEIQRGCYVVALYYTNGELETFRLPLITDREEAQKFCDLYEQQQQVDMARLILSPNNNQQGEHYAV